MEKRVIIAVVLSILIISLWQKFLVEIYPPPQESLPEETSTAIIQPSTIMTQEISKNDFTPSEKVNEEKHVFENEQFIVTINNIGGCIKQIELKEYSSGEPPVFYSLVSEDKIDRGIFTLTSPKLNIESDTLRYSILSKGDELECSTIMPSQIKVTKRYIFGEKDVIRFELEFENLGNEIQSFDYDIFGGVNIEAKEHFANRYLQVDTKVNDKVYRSRGARDKVLLHAGEVKWAALKNKYFVIMLKPFSPSSAGIVKQYGDKVLASGVRMAEISLSPRAKIGHEFLLYIGPKKPERLASIGMGFEEVIYYGIFGSISKVLLSILKFFHKMTHNWGVSIIILSALINLFLYPLTRKSLKSMHEMQKLQPEIKQLQEKYKKNPQRLNKEIMELYKKYKVNPLSGCFPMFLQLPIFVALYQALIRFVELKNAHFLWIKDLSLPDSVRLAFLGGKGIHILPLLMAGTMFFQQKFSHPQHQAGLTEQQRQQQKMMSIMMPLLFGFIFYNFPSGLVLYWFTNTLFMTLHQMVMLKKA